MRDRERFARSARIGDPAAAAARCCELLQTRDATPHAAARSGRRRSAASARPASPTSLLDLLSTAIPPIRAAALRSLRRVDAEGFVAILSGLDPDPDWSVRAALASVLGTLPARTGLPRLTRCSPTRDQRVIPAVLDALVKLKAPERADVLLEHLNADDPVVRAAAAHGLGELKPPDGAAGAAPTRISSGSAMSTYIARAAALDGAGEVRIAAARRRC